MHITQLHLLITIVATQVTALISGKVPFFPIEISRTAASSSLSYLVFNVGILSFIVTVLLVGLFDWNIFLLWIGLSIISIYDDVNHLNAHNLGLVVVAIAAIIRSYTINKWMMSIAAFIVFVCKIIVKVLPMYYCEVSSIHDIHHRSLEIMYYGSEKSLHPNITIPILQVSGVLQWLLFYLLSFVFLPDS